LAQHDYRPNLAPQKKKQYYGLKIKRAIQKPFLVEHTLQRPKQKHKNKKEKQM
jgi:hypothetical protein